MAVNVFRFNGEPVSYLSTLDPLALSHGKDVINVLTLGCTWEYRRHRLMRFERSHY
jgi:hypothetical protein